MAGESSLQISLPTKSYPLVVQNCCGVGSDSERFVEAGDRFLVTVQCAERIAFVAPESSRLLADWRNLEGSTGPLLKNVLQPFAKNCEILGASHRVRRQALRR